LNRLHQHLSDNHLIVASGHQCAPLAHQMLGTEETGLVRLSVGPATTDLQVQAACNVIAGFTC
ncbi:MAG: hypothetical protein AB8B50_20030, partial [Pirellulaceae bacterium]